MKDYKKVLLVGAACFLGFKLGQKLMKDKEICPCEVFDDFKDKAEDYMKKATGADKENTYAGIYTFGEEKRIEIVRLRPGVMGLYDNKLNIPIEKNVRSYSEDGDKLYVYATEADYVIDKDPFFLSIYVRDRKLAPAMAKALTEKYGAEEAAVYCYGEAKKVEPEVSEAAENTENAEEVSAE